MKSEPKIFSLNGIRQILLLVVIVVVKKIEAWFVFENQNNMKTKYVDKNDSLIAAHSSVNPILWSRHGLVFTSRAAAES